MKKEAKEAETEAADPNEGRRAPLPETIDSAKEAARLTKEDRERQDGQGAKEEAKPEGAKATAAA